MKSLTIFSLCGVGAVGLLSCSAVSLAGDWPSPEDAWLPAPDGFVWPDTELAVEFKEFPTAELDSAVDGVLIPNLESADSQPTTLAAWVELGNDSRTLLYVDRALSGTGGKYVFVLVKQDGQWLWLGEMLCGRVNLGKHARDGWRTITCVAQRGLQYQRMLYAMCQGKYRGVRHELHDLEKSVVVLRPTTCVE